MEKQNIETINILPEQDYLPFFPALQPFNTGFIKVSELHTVYYEQCGNPEGKPVIVLHGGPGGGIHPSYRTFHDPNDYRIILMDQRGCGQSTPHACLEENTTWHLVADIETLRKHLNIEKWQVFGGSWGSTLSITYAETHPECVTELILRGIFMLRRRELEFFYQEGSSWIYPDAWEQYRDHIPENERHDFIQAYHKRLTSDDLKVRLAAAVCWTTWESATCKLIVDQDHIQETEEEKFALQFARIENHYFYNHGFFKTDEQLLEDAYKIDKIPIVIVQGRYDMVCPMKSAWDFKKKLPNAELKIVQNAGHSAGETGIRSELIKACKKFAKKL